MVDTAVASLNKHTNEGNSLEEELNLLLSSSSSFSVASYLNLALGSQNEMSSSSSIPTQTTYSSRLSSQSSLSVVDQPDELQRRMAELALQLQIQTQSCHEDIGRTGAGLQAVLPRCAADVGRVGVGLEGMRIDAQTLLETTAITGKGDEISSSLETLSTLHALQANLSKTKEVLTAAATWDSTISSVAPLLAEQNLAEAVNALAQLETGERSLRGMPHRQERQESIKKIRQQVQNLLQPQLQHALQNMHSRLAPLQQCVALYSKLDKMDSLRDNYVKQRPGVVHKAWFSYSPPMKTYNNNNGDLGKDDKTPMMSSSDQAAITQETGETFLSWLPSWYEIVLNLLAEERRQASTVFGPTEAPEILVKVLREVFRPILSSFQSRLEIIFSSAVSGPIRGSLETICSIYESTLRFLSLTYDLVAGTYLDLVESGVSKKGDTGFDLYQDMHDVFLQVGSPFALYAQRFADLEGKNSQVAAGMVSKDMQQTVGAVSSSSSLHILQETIGRLKDLASFIFPIVDGSLDRFELLNAGYRANPALRTVDAILSNHLGELVISIRSLSASITTNVNKFADDFDEQHVLCAMEVLKIAGNFRRDLRNFERGTRKRMKALSERMIDYLTREALKDTASVSNGRTVLVNSSFSFPDSLSVVEIDSFLTNIFCGDNRENDKSGTNTSLATLQQMGASPQELSCSEFFYLDAEEAVKRLARSCHSFVFDVCSSVPRMHLDDLSQMVAWKEVATTDGIDSYGTLPQQYITQVGEHMLALVQIFEPFAADPATLSLVNEAMDGVKDVALQPWSEFVSAAGLVGSDSVVSSLMNGTDITDFVLSNAALGEEDAALEEGATEEEVAIAAFCNSWLDVIGLAITGRLLEKIMRIPQLTSTGCEHLTADLNYLINVFSALGVAGHPHPLVSHMATLATLSDVDLKAHIEPRHGTSDVENALKGVDARIALIRGISLG